LGLCLVSVGLWCHAASGDRWQKALIPGGQGGGKRPVSGSAMTSEQIPSVS
jgi:hypothetical protein